MALAMSWSAGPTPPICSLMRLSGIRRVHSSGAPAQVRNGAVARSMPRKPTRPAPRVIAANSVLPAPLSTREMAPLRRSPAARVSGSVPSGAAAPAHLARATAFPPSCDATRSTGSSASKAAVRACQSGPPSTTSWPPAATQRSMERRCDSVRELESAAHTIVSIPRRGSGRSGRSLGERGIGSGNPAPRAISCGRRLPPPSPTIATVALVRSRTLTSALTVAREAP